MNPIASRLLVQVLRDRPNAWSMKLMSGFMVLSAVGALVASQYINRPVFGHALFLTLISGLGYLWCGDFLKSAILQNQPSCAVLVPGLRVALLRLTAKLYLGCTLASAALGWLMLGHPGYVMIVGGALTVFILFAHRYPYINLLPSVIILGSLSLKAAPVYILETIDTAVGEPMLALAGGVILLLLGAKGVQLCFPQGGDAHWKWRRCLVRQRAARRGEWNNIERTGGIRWLAWLREPYNAALRADSRQGVNQGRQLVHVLGSAGYDGNAMLYLVFSGVLMAALMHWQAVGRDAAVMTIWRVSMQCILMLSALSYANGVVISALRYAGEQVLYRLTPAAPASAQFNRVLMRTLLGRYLRLWLICMLSVVGIDYALQDTFQLQGTTYLLGMLMLPFAALMMRNFATARPQSANWGVVGLPLLVMIPYLMAITFSRYLPDDLLFSLGSVVGLASLIGLRWRWQHMMKQPPVLPASRLVL